MLRNEQRFALNRDGKRNNFSFVFYPTPDATDLTVTVKQMHLRSSLLTISRTFNLIEHVAVRCTVRPVLTANCILFIRMQSFSELNERRVHELYASLLLTDETLPTTPS